MPASIDLFVLLFIAVAIGWLAGFYVGRKKKISKEPDFIPSIDYLLAQNNDATLKKLLAVPNLNSDTIELYINLGRSLRHKGEVERAIHLHQSLFARTSLPKSTLLKLELELAVDFLRAGLFDRAERLLLELVKVKSDIQSRACLYLLELYEEEGSWQEIINVYEKKQLLDNDEIRQRVGHAICEIAKKHLDKNNYLDAHKALRKALKIYDGCSRAFVLQGNLAKRQNEHHEAIRCYLKAVAINKNAIIHLLPSLVESFSILQDEQGLLQHLNEHWHRSHYVEVLEKKTEIEAKLYGPYQALENLIRILKEQPTDRAFFILIDLIYKHKLSMDMQGALELHGLVKKIAEQSPLYICNDCGFKAKEPHWQCPSCKKWSSIEPAKPRLRRLTEDAYDSF